MAKNRELFRATPSKGLDSRPDGVVDREQHVIYGASVISTGEAIGHGVEIDKQTVSQVVDLGNASKMGVKVRFGHPNMSSNAEGSFLGRAKNFRIDKDGDIARADIHLADVAFSGTAQNAGEYTEDLAEEDPDAFGVSIVFEGDREYRMNEDGTRAKDDAGNELMPLARVKRLWATDVVDEPATGDGMFSRTTILSATFTEQLDKLLNQEDSAATVEAFLSRYAAGRHIDSAELREKLTRMFGAVISHSTAPAGGDAVDTNANPQQEELDMGNENGQTPLNPQENAAAEALHKREVEEARTAERKRIKRIRELGAKTGARPDDIEKAINEDMAFEAAFELFNVNAALAASPAIPRVTVQHDERDNFMTAATAAVSMRAGLPVEPEVEKNVRKSEYRGLTLMGLARRCLTRAGVNNVDMMDNADTYNALMSGMSVQRVMFAPGGSAQTTGDFVSVLSNVLNKSLAKGWETAGTSYQLWTGSGTLRDFKQADLIKVSEFSDILEVPEGEAAKYGQFSDTHEHAQLKTYGRLYSLTRQAMINDDLNWFSRVPARMTGSVRRKINKMVYGLLFNNNGAGPNFVGPLMGEDGIRLFNLANHANYLATGTGGAVTEATVGAGYNAMRAQQAPSPDGGASAAIALNLRPRYLLCDRVNEVAAAVLNGSQLYSEVGAAVAGSQPINVYGPGAARNLQVISDEEIAINTAGMWYLAADQNIADTVSVYTLNGRDAPTTKTEDATISEPQGIAWSVMHDFTIVAADWRGLYCNAGA